MIRMTFRAKIDHETDKVIQRLQGYERYRISINPKRQIVLIDELDIDNY